MINFPLKSFVFVVFCSFFSSLNSKITAAIFVRPNEIVKWMLLALGRAIKVQIKNKWVQEEDWERFDWLDGDSGGGNLRTNSMEKNMHFFKNITIG